MNVNWDDEIPNIWENKKMFQTTNQTIILVTMIALFITIIILIIVISLLYIIIMDQHQTNV